MEARAGEAGRSGEGASEASLWGDGKLFDEDECKDCWWAEGYGAMVSAGTG